MKTITENQLRAIHTLMGKFNVTDKKDKESIISTFSAKRTTSSKELTFNEAGAIIEHFQSMDLSQRRSERMRNKILMFAHEMGWETSPSVPLRVEREGSPRTDIKPKKKVDIERINNWCIKFGYLHKKLDEYTYEELPKLVSQFEEVYKGHLKGV